GSIVFLSAAFEGWLLTRMPGWQRWLLGLAALPLVVAKPMTILIGLVMALPVLALQLRARAALPKTA
ncbi:MAG: hypothetical protein ACRCTI_09685, partial [Beijerinckiaceae bacterium]